MKKLLCLALCLLALTGCAAAPTADIAATTLPVYEFTARLCQGTDISVARLVTEQVSCLHDYSLNVSQVKAAEAADAIVISGAGLETFLDGLLTGEIIDASQGIPLLEGQPAHEGHHHDHGHDPHIWLSPENAKVMAVNLCQGLSALYPEHRETFEKNLASLQSDLEDLQRYGQSQLKDLSCRQLITFHDGFSYFAQSFDLEILEAVEEESGSEPSAQELIHLCNLVREHHLRAIFTERSGSDAAAQIISRETGAPIFQLDMAMAGDSYFEAMRHNIDTIQEALS